MEKTVFKLSLMLAANELSKEETEILKKYGQADKGIIREVLAPANMTLHALHYMINRAFGWTNSHLHDFSPPLDVFQKITGGADPTKQKNFCVMDGLYTDWEKLCGVYFRFPFKDNGDFYWDDDYSGSQGINTWLKKKYTGPYKKNSLMELYTIANDAAKKFRAKNPKINKAVHFDSFEEFEKSADLKRETTPIKKAQIEDAAQALNGPLDTFLERLELKEVLRSYKEKEPKNLKEEVYKLADKQAKAIENLPVIPITDLIIYTYDYGDGWTVYIRLDESCKINEDTGEVFCGEKKIEGEMGGKIIEVAQKQRPVCLALDGLSVMDDAGGVFGYIDFLRTLNEGDKEEKAEAKEWARDMGWSNKMKKPEKLL